MEWVKKIAAGILMLLAFLGLLICLAGIIGTLAVNAPLSNTVVGIIETTDSYFTTIDQTNRLIHTRVASLHENVSRIRDQLDDTNISDAQVLRGVLGQIADSDMAPAIENLIITSRAVSDGLVAFNSGMVALNQIPGVNLPTISEELEAVNIRLQEMRAEVEVIQTNLTSSQGIKTRLLQPVDRLTDNLNQVESSLAEGQAHINQIQASLNSMRIKISRLIDLASLTLVLIFSLFGAGQVLLIERSWKWFKSLSPGRSHQMQEVSREPLPATGEEASSDKTI